MTACVLIKNKLWIPSGPKDELELRFLTFFSTFSTVNNILLNSMPMILFDKLYKYIEIDIIKI